jgi:sugar phosphate isomerase/epimerase
MSRRVSVAHLTALETAPPDLIHMAADAGFNGVGLRLIGISAEAIAWPLMQDKAMLRETIRACRTTGLTVPDVEFIRLTPDLNVGTLEPFIDAGAELGAKHIIVAPYDSNRDRLAETLAELNALAQRYGLNCALEFFPWANIPNLASAMDVIGRTQDPSIGVLVDSLHFERSGAPWLELESVPVERLPFCHLSDAEACYSHDIDALLFVARENRLPPGEGMLDLIRFLKTLPADCPIAVEIPNAIQMQEHGAAVWLKHIGEATHKLLAKIPNTPEKRP